MANDSQLRASEIKDVLLRQIEQYEDALQAEEIGEVLEVKDGIARIYGLTKAMASEMLEITSSETGDTVTALALNLEEDNIGAVIMGDWTSLHEGDQVRRTGRVLDVPVGAGYLGRVVDPLGDPQDGLGDIDGIEDRRQIDIVAPGIVQAAAGRRADADGHQGHRLDDPDRPRPARADHRRPRHGEDRRRDRRDHQPEEHRRHLHLLRRRSACR